MFAYQATATTSRHARDSATMECDDVELKDVAREGGHNEGSNPQGESVPFEVLEQLPRKIADVLEAHLSQREDSVAEVFSALSKSTLTREEDRAVLERIEGKVDRMEERLVTRDQEIKELKMVLNTKDEEIQRLRDTATKRNSEVVRLKSQNILLQAKDCRQYPSTTSSNHEPSSTPRLRSETTNWKQKYDLKEEDVQRLKQKCALVEKERKSAIQQKNKELASQKEECKALEERLSKNERQISRLDEQQQQLHAQLQQKNEEAQALQVHNSELQSQLATKEMELQSFQEQTAQLNSDLKVKQDELTTTLSHNVGWQKYADELNGKLRRYEEAWKHMQQRLDRTEEEQKTARSQSTEVKQKGRSAAEDLQIQQGGDHDKLLEEMEEIFTDPDGILSTLEKHLSPYEAKVLLCEAFQAAYDIGKDEVINLVAVQLHRLFENSGSSQELDYTSRAYGMLLHATKARSDRCAKQAAKEITTRVHETLRGSPLFAKFLAKLSTKHSTSKEDVRAPVNRIVNLAWRLVTLPCPVIVCQPESFVETIMDKETLHWDPKAKSYRLVYSEPVVYRSYHGTIVERKGTVGNEPVSTGEPPSVPETQAQTGHKSCVIA